MILDLSNHFLQCYSLIYRHWIVFDFVIAYIINHFFENPWFVEHKDAHDRLIPIFCCEGDGWKHHIVFGELFTEYSSKIGDFCEP